MKKIILLLLLFVSISIGTVNPTYSSYLNFSTSSGNAFSASTLDFSLRNTSDVVLPSPLFNITGMIPGNSDTKIVRVTKEAAEDYKYQINYSKTAGNDALCNALQIEAKFEGTMKYSGSLSSLNITPLTNTGTSNDWDLVISLTDSSSSFRNKSCSFNLTFKGWQTDSDGTWGYADEEVVGNTVSTGTWVASGDVVINEIMWMGSLGSEHPSDDEWIELKNSTGNPIDLTGWKIDGAGSASDSITLSGTIPSNGFFLISHYSSDHSAINNSITIDQTISGISLNNSGEQLTLKTSTGSTIDQTPSGAWAAGENETNKKSMERNDDPSSGWHTCTDSACNDTAYWDSEGNNYGTPKAANLSSNDPSSPDFKPDAQNSVSANLTPEANSSPSSSSETTPSPTPTSEPTPTPIEDDVSPTPIPEQQESNHLEEIIQEKEPKSE